MSFGPLLAIQAHSTHFRSTPTVIPFPYPPNPPLSCSLPIDLRRCTSRFFGHERSGLEIGGVAMDTWIAPSVRCLIAQSGLRACPIEALKVILTFQWDSFTLMPGHREMGNTGLRTQDTGQGTRRGGKLSMATVAALWKNHPPCGPIVLAAPVVVVCQHRYSRHYSAPSYLAQRDLKVKRIHYVLCARRQHLPFQRPHRCSSLPPSSCPPVAHCQPLFYLLFQFVCRRGGTIKIHFIVAAPTSSRRQAASFIPCSSPRPLFLNSCCCT